MTTTSRSEFNAFCEECLAMLNQEGLLIEQPIAATLLHKPFEEFFRYSGIGSVDSGPSQPNFTPPPLPSQTVIDNITLRCALILTNRGGWGFHFNEQLNLLRSYIVDILIDHYGESYKPLRFIGQRWGCYLLWVDIARINDDRHIEETRQYFRDHEPEHFEEYKFLLPQE